MIESDGRIGTRSVHIEVPPNPASIAIARSAVRRVVAFRNDDACSSFLISLTEILSNAIDEHVRIDSELPVLVAIESGERDTVSVRDAGHGFDPTAHTAQSPGAERLESEVRERGRGIALARAFVPALVLRSGPDGTEATLPLDGLGIVR